MSLTQEVKQKAKEAGFALVGVAKPDALCDLPYGWVGRITNLRPAEELMPNVKSILLLGLKVRNRALNLAVSSPDWKGYGMPSPTEQSEDYQFYYEVLKNKAWQVVDYLVRRGYDAAFSFKVPLTTAAVKCGLGCQGKNTLLISADFGPRIRLIAVLTNAELDADKPYVKNLCENCQKCVEACPTKALKPYRIDIPRCLTYAAESPCTEDIPKDVRALEKRLILKPVPNSFVECTTCIDACPVGKTRTK
jgi:epoxyqueuosine reductase